MRKCKTCRIPLWFAWIINGWPWEERAYKYDKAIDCIDLLPKRITDNIWKKIKEMSKEENNI